MFTAKKVYAMLENESLWEAATHCQTVKDYVSRDLFEELMKEARLMRELEHPNIVRCLGIAAEVEPVRIFMLVEYE